MFWRMAGLSTTSPVESILDKENFTLEELLDEDEIIQECKALNGRLINFLRERNQIEQLIRYIVEEAPEDAEKRRIFKFPFIACEIFTCEVDIILRTLVENVELMNLLFSFLEPKELHSTLLAGYFSKVVICLLLRKTVIFMHYIRDHQEILGQLVDLIGITSIMEILIRLIGADEHMFSSYSDAMQWIEDTDVLERIVDKFSSSDSPEVHANAAETLCSIIRFAPPGLAAKISSPNFIGRLFDHALEESRPKSVLVNSLSVCITLLDPKRLSMGTYHTYNHQSSHGSTIASPETVDSMLASLGALLKLLDLSSVDNVLLTPYGKLQPPLGKQRLKIVEFISVLLTASSEAAEKELIRLGAVQRILDLFFGYPYNNFLHHHVENIIFLCLESKNTSLIEHLFHGCNLVGKILEAEKNFTLVVDPSKPTVPAEGRSPPRIGNNGHLTRISNKLVQLAENNNDIQAYLQENNDWTDWHANVLIKRNAVENIYQWACGRPTFALQDQRDSDDDDYQDRDYDIASLANNLSQAFGYDIYNNDDIDAEHGSVERDDEDVYFDDESAEVVISSLRLGDDQESGSLFTNSNWFAFEDDRVASERSAGSVASSSPNNMEIAVFNGRSDGVVSEDDLLDDTATSSPVSKPNLDDISAENVSKNISENDKPPVWVEWRETLDSNDPSEPGASVTLNGERQVDLGDQSGDVFLNAPERSNDTAVEGLSNATSESPGTSPLSPLADEIPKLDPAASDKISEPDPAASDEIPKLDPTASDKIPEPDHTASNEIPEPDPTVSDKIPGPDPTVSEETPEPDPTASNEIPEPDPTASNEIPEPDPTVSDEIPEPDPTASDKIPKPDPIFSDEIPKPEDPTVSDETKVTLKC